jgi:PEGA domain-containing protein
MAKSLPVLVGWREWWAGLMVVSLTVFAPAVRAAPAPAPPAAVAPTVIEDPKSLARNKLVEGGELLKQGEYRAALVRFQEAYALVPSPKILYNFALAYTNLGRTTEAVEAFERFLDEATDANPETRANAERHRSELLPKIATVVIRCEADGAEISVDGRSYGTTPRKNPIRLDPGPHSLIVEKPPLPAFTRKLDVRAGERVVVEVKLEGTPSPTVAATPALAASTPIAAVPAAPPEAPSPPLGWKNKAAIGLGVAAILGLGFGAQQQLAASAKYGDFNRDMVPSAMNPSGKCDADARVLAHGGGDCSSLLSSGDSASLRAKIGFIAGGALAASSIGLFLLARRDHSGGATTASAGCLPAGEGVACAFAF